MRRWLGIPLLFFATAAVLWLGMVAIGVNVRVGPYPVIHQVTDGINLKGGNTYRKFREFDPARHYDAVFIGSSHAYRGYDPAQFAEAGYATFNLGTSAQTPLNSFYIVEDLLTSDNTGLLVVDVYRGAFELDGLESTADLVQNTVSNRAAIGLALAMRDARTLNMLAVRGFTAGRPPYYLDSTYVGSGFSVHTDSVSGDPDYAAMHRNPVRGKQVHYLERLLVLCNERGIPVVLVDHPAPQETRGPWHAEWQREVRRIAEEHGVPFVDMAYSVAVDSRAHFHDHTHLNAAGVALFNAALIARLQEMDILPAIAPSSPRSR